VFSFEQIDYDRTIYNYITSFCYHSISQSFVVEVDLNLDEEVIFHLLHLYVKFHLCIFIEGYLSKLINEMYVMYCRKSTH
jgi:hypothetical protein